MSYYPKLMRPFRRVFENRIEPVLGTRLDVAINTTSHRSASGTLATLLGEIDRLERIFSIYDTSSELNLWKRSSRETAIVSDDLALLMRLGLQWQQRTHGLFHPAMRQITERWRQAERDGTSPTQDELGSLLARLAQEPYLIDGNTITRTSMSSHLDFNALAKGLIVDRACDTTWQRHHPHTMMINLGGDLVHRGQGSVRVNIENPGKRADNAVPISSTLISNSAAATSGNSWRGFSVNGEWLGHVIDPRTAKPSATAASATVVAASVAAADAAATALTILGADAGAEFAAAEYPDIAAWFIVDIDGHQRRSNTWG
jgi:FAD:protein FMN transferase